MSFEKYKGHRIDTDTITGECKKYLLDDGEIDAAQCLAEIEYGDTTRNRASFHQAATWFRKVSKRKKQPSLFDRPPIKLKGVPEPEPKKEVEPWKMKTTLPKEGIELKVENGTGMLATLNIDKRGISVKRANSKMSDPRVITWRILESLSAIGLMDE